MLAACTVWCCVGALLLSGLALLSLASRSKINSFAGPYRIVPDHVELCPVTSSNRVQISPPRGFRDRHDPNLWYYSANMTWPFKLDNLIDVDINWASWSQRGGWKDNALVMRPGSLCTFGPVHVPDAWRMLMVATFNDPKRMCPFPAGKYEVKNLSTDVSFKNVPVFFYGTWRVTVHLYHNLTKDTKLCAQLFGKTIPK